MHFDDTAYEDMENAIGTLNGDANDEANADTNGQEFDDEYERMENSLRNSLETVEVISSLAQNSINSRDQDIMAVAHEDMDHTLKQGSKRVVARQSQPPVPPGRISAQLEQMMEALDDDERAVAKKIAKERAAAEATRKSTNDNDMESDELDSQGRDGVTQPPAGASYPVTPPQPPTSSVSTASLSSSSRGQLERHDDVAIRSAESIRPTPRSMLQRQDSEATSRQEPILLEASLVPDVPLYEATLITDEGVVSDSDNTTKFDQFSDGENALLPWWKKRQGCLLVTLILTFGGAMAIMGALLTSNNGDDAGGVNKDSNQLKGGVDEPTTLAPVGQADSPNNGSPQTQYPVATYHPTQSPVMQTNAPDKTMGRCGFTSYSGGNTHGLGKYLTFGVCISDDDCTLEIQSHSQSESNSDVEQCKCYAASSIDVFAECEGEDDSACLTAPCDDCTRLTVGCVHMKVQPSQQSPVSTNDPSQAPITMAPTVSLYYPDWAQDRCVGDVSGRPGAEQGQTLFMSIEACCKAEFWHLQDNTCLMNSLGLTRSPSASPSMKPTLFPTRSPSRSPSRKPSPSPSKSPTQVPTREPTSTPSQSPTQNPTAFSQVLSKTPRPTASCTFGSMEACCASRPPPDGFANKGEFCHYLGCNFDKCLIDVNENV